MSSLSVMTSLLFWQIEAKADEEPEFAFADEDSEEGFNDEMQQKISL